MKKFFKKVSAKIKGWSFLTSFAQFILLGLKQMFGYAANLLGSFLITTVSVVAEFFSILKMLRLSGAKGWRKVLSFIFLGLGIGAFFGVVILFGGATSFLGLDLHAAEYAARGFFMLSMLFAGADAISLLLGTYPGLFIHKLLVNKGSGLSWIDSQTDDATGRTWSMKLFGKKLSIPRFNQKTRLVLGGISLILGLIWSLKEPKPDIPPAQKIEQHPGRLFYDIAPGSPRADAGYYIASHHIFV